MIPAGRSFVIALLALLLLTAAVAAPVFAWAALALDVALVLGCAIDGVRARRDRLSAVRVWPPLLVQGAAAPVRVRLHGGRRLTLHLRDALHPALAGQPARVTLELAPGQECEWSRSIVPKRRGTHSVGPLTARVLGPWGLAWSQRDVLPSETVRVYPQVRWDGAVGRLLALAHRRELGLSPVRRRGLGGEMYGLREYRPGDPRSRIHWKASARHGRLILKEDTWERGRRLVILLDSGRAMASVRDERSKLDHALAAALALSRVAVSRGDTIGIATFSDRLERVVRVEARGLARVYESLFDVEARMTEPAFGTLTEIVGSLEHRRATVVLFTSVVDLGAAEVLKEALVGLARRHRVILVNLEDADLSRLAFGVPDSLAEAYAKVSAMGIVLANRGLGRRLVRSGVQVVTTAADELAWEALGAYLELEGRGRARPA
jgi:uncharacterized protein (DUF58 family)